MWNLLLPIFPFDWFFIAYYKPKARGTICDDGFGEEEARVVCRTLGLTGGVVTKGSDYEYDDNDEELIIAGDNLQCTGHEDNLMECKVKSINWSFSMVYFNK